MNTLGIYEKAIPFQGTWKQTLQCIHEIGFHYMEFSIDESDEKLARLHWSKAEREELRQASLETGVRLHTLMLSGHRRFPLGATDPNIRAKAIEILRLAVDLAVDLGISHIQMAGYDVYYEPKSVLTRAYYIEGLKQCVAIAAQKGVVLSIETMDDPFLNNLAKIKALKQEIASPWLQGYPDLGNISAWPENDVACDLEANIDIVTCTHLKDTLAVRSDFPGKFKEVPFGEGCVDFLGCLRTLKRLNYNGGLTIEMWTGQQDDAMKTIRMARSFFMDLFNQAGIEIADVE
ncbi:MAG: L-ribulose-5-phosphate 3-epimerase [Aerococcus sp.]|nr:L-ribulose-5-phosphate 3-epimerase [Aerococcus sp.]